MLARVNNELTLMPWRNLAELQNELMNSFAEFGDFGKRTTYPWLNVENGEKEIKVTACLPGYDQKNIDVEVVNDFITIKAVRQETSEEKDARHLRSERSFGEYEETLKLASRVRSEDAKANYKNGVLEIVLPKIEAPTPQRIAVSA